MLQLWTDTGEHASQRPRKRQSFRNFSTVKRETQEVDTGQEESRVTLCFHVGKPFFLAKQRRGRRNRIAPKCALMEPFALCAAFYKIRKRPEVFARGVFATKKEGKKKTGMSKEKQPHRRKRGMRSARPAETQMRKNHAGLLSRLSPPKRRSEMFVNGLSFFKVYTAEGHSSSITWTRPFLSTILIRTSGTKVCSMEIK